MTKRTDGFTLVPWCYGKIFTCDMTVETTLAISYLASSSRSANSVAQNAAVGKMKKYSQPPVCYKFQPMVLESLEDINSLAIVVLSEAEQSGVW
jgi:hypothetical protein